MKKTKKPYKASVKGKDWEFHMQSNASYVRKHGNDSGAITYLTDHDTFINEHFMFPSKVRHELVHVYVSCSGISSASLTADQMEELCAEIYESYGPEMDMLVDKILEHFLR